MGTSFRDDHMNFALLVLINFGNHNHGFDIVQETNIFQKNEKHYFEYIIQLRCFDSQNQSGSF